jgi:1-acyl-sn-glycerol-3-phosphate acyltransferase
VMTRAVYRFRVRGEEHIPTTGAAILACNHVSYVDAVLLMAASPRPIRFIMDHRIFSVPVLGWLFRLAKAIPIAPQQENPQVYAAAFEQARQVLEDGDLLGIFPEGNITRDGALAEFKGGIMKVLEMQPVPVVPMALQNLWGSTFSRVENGKAMARPLRRGLFSRVGLAVGPAIAATDMSLAGLQARVRQLLQS